MKLTSRLTSAMILIETKECESDGDHQYRSGEERRGEERRGQRLGREEGKVGVDRKANERVCFRRRTLLSRRRI